MPLSLKTLLLNTFDTIIRICICTTFPWLKQLLYKKIISFLLFQVEIGWHDFWIISSTDSWPIYFARIANPRTFKHFVYGFFVFMRSIRIWRLPCLQCLRKGCSICLHYLGNYVYSCRHFFPSLVCCLLTVNIQILCYDCSYGLCWIGAYWNLYQEEKVVFRSAWSISVGNILS